MSSNNAFLFGDISNISNKTTTTVEQQFTFSTTDKTRPVSSKKLIFDGVIITSKPPRPNTSKSINTTLSANCGDVDNMKLDLDLLMDSDGKVKIEKGLDESTKVDVLRLLPSFKMPEVPDAICNNCVSRATLTWAFGSHAHSIPITLRLPFNCETQGICLNPTVNPDCPREAGDHGLFLSDTPWKSDYPVRVFTRDEKQPVAMWRYKGDYVYRQSTMMDASAWLSQSQNMRAIWLVLLYYHDYSQLRAKVYFWLREECPTDEQIQSRITEEARRWKAEKAAMRPHHSKCSEDDYYRGRKAAVGFEISQLRTAMDTGVVNLWITALECVNYDIEFQQLLGDIYNQWVEAGNPKKARPELAGMNLLGTDVQSTRQNNLREAPTESGEYSDSTKNQTEDGVESGLIMEDSEDAHDSLLVEQTFSCLKRRRKEGPENGPTRLVPEVVVLPLNALPPRRSRGSRPRRNHRLPVRYVQ